MMTQEAVKNYKRKIALRNMWIVIGGALLLISIFFISMNIGYSKLSILDALNTIIGKGTENQELILFQYRLPRIVISVLIGAGLSLSGCIIQGISRNPLAEPGLLGINAGAGLMAILYALLLGITNFLSVFTLPFLALIGAAAAAVAVYFLAYKKQEGISSDRLVLTGIAVQAGISALTTVLIVSLDDMKFSIVAGWQAGQIWGANWQYVLALLPWLCALIPYVLFKAKSLDVLNLGDEVAIALGMSVERERRNLFAISVMLAACCVGVGGNISFVGLIAPHLARRLVGPKHRILLPVCALTGAVLVCVADTLGRILIQPSSIPTGIMTSIIGAPYFIYLLTKSKQQ